MVGIINLFSKKILFGFAALLLILASCSENPSITGYNLVGPSDSLVVTKFDSILDSSFTYTKKIIQTENLGTTRRILVGNYEDVKSYALIRFLIGLSTELKEAVKNSNATIASAKLNLYPVYRFGDSTLNSFSMEIREIKTPWNEYTFTIDSLLSDRYLISDENISLNNLDQDSIYYCELNPAAVLDWFKAIADDSLSDLQGILISPTNSTNYIKGFASLNSYFDKDPIVLEVVVNYNSKTDTLKYYANADLHVIKKENSISQDNQYIVVQSGIKQKSFLYFDISKVPQRSIVNSAYLRMYLDSLKSNFGTSFQDSLLILYVTDSTNISIDSSTAMILTRTPYGYYEGNISYFVQKWIDNNTNRGLLLNSRDPDGGLERFEFYGPDYFIREKRPQLIINYSYIK